jgi:hypothetical protein
MELSTIVIIILLITSILLFILNFLKTCPTQKPAIIVYKSFPELDLQFDENNFPSKVLDNVFTGNNIWLGGYNGSMNTAIRVAQGYSSNSSGLR